MKTPIIVSMVADAVDTATRDVPASKIIAAIQQGKWRTSVEQIRRLYAEATLRTGDREAAMKAAKLAVAPLKKNLPAILWSGRFKHRSNGALIEHSGLICADQDDLGSEALKAVRPKLLTSPYLWALFHSPTGKGLKAIFRVPADPLKHLASFRAVYQHVLELTGRQIDQSCKDVPRLCFVSYDPDCYFNPDAPEIEPQREPEKPKALFDGVINLSERQRIATELLGAIDWQSQTSGFVTCPGKHLHTTSDAERDCRVDFDQVPTVHCFHNSCRGILDRVNHELRSRIGKAEYVKPETPTIESQSEIDTKPTTNDTTDLTSLSSPAVDYPAPLGEPAYYGLAGDIVQRIEPHTEADPAAMLFQFLAAFGNIIGRTAYMVADGARHYLNLFGVLVGLSSKGRKGTSWNQIARVLSILAKSWTNNNCANGLSSGEGLIWAVRDPASERRPIREKGGRTVDYETVVTDEGVADKRLFVLEGEFANVLKVMAREGNTLSSIIRSAWDNGDLRTLTKNSPARATGAHISIIGHITREELRRHLTETEQGNGFANRFLWLAVKRSKCLPEGGNIQSENLSDLVKRLHDAIEFARSAREITRSEGARELWRIVYPELSEGKPRLLGAITARAEAQVLRLSCIYALLDCSTTISVEHHRAALALWNYCDRSARWIFATATGDPRADKILFALRIAGTSGMTKTEISERVFNRNVSAGALADALRILHQSGQAKFRKESTAGAPCERWFAGIERTN